jgi:hypothetical protein
MRCAKCNKEMVEGTKGNKIVKENGFFWCQNTKCWFFGIERFQFSE